MRCIAAMESLPAPRRPTVVLVPEVLPPLVQCDTDRAAPTGRRAYAAASLALVGVLIDVYG